mmetsp:Transcript_3490/g.12590  ORF Transcript_3490/g.12590 Transcript_3490/m.12590 type:complete len:98 (-) Transcript_3490:194-487(-)
MKSSKRMLHLHYEGQAQQLPACVCLPPRQPLHSHAYELHGPDGGPHIVQVDALFHVHCGTWLQWLLPIAYRPSEQHDVWFRLVDGIVNPSTALLHTY